MPVWDLFIVLAITGAFVLFGVVLAYGNAVASGNPDGGHLRKRRSRREKKPYA